MTALEKDPIVTATDIARVEQESIAAGASSEGYMVQAGKGIAKRVDAFMTREKRKKEVTLLIGKGNNGGDGYVAGLDLLSRGYRVVAYHFFPFEESSPLCQKHEERFLSSGGKVFYPTAIDDVDFFEKGAVVDGLFGTGFQGKLEGIFFDLAKKLNRSIVPVLAIDIPSGVNGTTGTVGSLAIEAEETFFLGAPKWGFFVGEGLDSIGRLRAVSFGLDPVYFAQMEAKGHLVNPTYLAQNLPRARRSQHKYEAGYVLAVAGSPTMPGAACLASLAALRTGAGMVRLFYPEGMEALLAATPYEIVRTPYRAPDCRPLLEEGARASAWLIGPGLGREKETEALIATLLPQLEVPAVIDADALFLAAGRWKGARAPLVLTPHYGEMERLLGEKKLPREELFARTQAFCNEMKVTVLLKGALSCVFHPDTKPLMLLGGTPGMATAGSGDVLTGMISALLAKRVEVRTAAALGAYLHALAGEHVARKHHAQALIASDLIAALPAAFRQLEHMH